MPLTAYAAGFTRLALAGMLQPALRSGAPCPVLEVPVVSDHADPADSREAGLPPGVPVCSPATVRSVRRSSRPPRGTPTGAAPAGRRP
ncbi:hypothetical protein AB0C13_28395 [Streptomyces sp. NPDC049099]|uniref:hypothetical protein n=1 Tax=Streptomyces sp. NPDC049099 TaxID=3155768 RepID=UPI003421657F